MQRFVVPFLLGIYFCISCASDSKRNPAERFLSFLNNYSTDSIQVILADDFEYKMSFYSYTQDKKTFIEKNVTRAKQINQKFNILNTAYEGTTTDFLVGDESDYFKYMEIDPPNWRIKIITNGQEKVETMIVDTTEGYQNYVTSARLKGKQFENWLKTNYPGETHETIYNTPELLIKRLKEYSNE